MYVGVALNVFECLWVSLSVLECFLVYGKSVACVRRVSRVCNLRHGRGNE